MHLYFVPSSWRSAQKTHTKNQPSCGTLPRGTFRDVPVTLLDAPAAASTFVFHTAVVPSFLYLYHSFSARLRQNQKQPQRTYAVYDPTGSNARQTNWRNKPSPPTIAVACQATALSAFSSPPLFLPESASVSVFSLHNWTNGSYHPRTKVL
ncbi:uncharacterized protein CCOS01_07802 [Colletotrichum costaricense]|uniref:Uncharacterized protein n=1 Tax=Colletotrichum costaricense TaxID=1209916 RepID=A0AAI9YX92_9PEZI|nr:uncharacterized protein CCOS01_07802 [Colletotrichum costaricense]KAK1527540.1 hypothetical protein CCOS01_07802 [Colletotrichum costaricense]